MMLKWSTGAAAPTAGRPQAARPALPRLGRRLVTTNVAPGRREAPTARVGAAQPPAEGASSGGGDYFMDALLRSFLLGVGAGALVETTHVLFKFLGLAAESGAEIMDVLPLSLPEFAPLFVWDHVAAVGGWVLLYIVEAIAILSVLKAYPDDAKKADLKIRRMATLTKRLVPLKLSALKTALYSISSSVSKPAAATSAAGAAAADAAPGAAPLAFRDGGAGAGTLERVREEIARDAERGPRIPRGPEPPRKPKRGDDEDTEKAEAKAPAPVPAPQTAKAPRGPAAAGGALAERRRAAGLRPGQLDPSVAAPGLSRRDRELEERKGYLKNFWYAAALSSAVGYDKPLGVDILGGRVTLFRDQETGEVVCINDWCPHRGAPLSGGQVKQDKEGHTCVVCPYHGWAFDAEGRLRDVPSAEPGRWPKRPMVPAYPVVERGGFVWLFFGDLPEDLRPPVPASFAPELEDPKWHAVYGEIEFECGHWGVFENAIDMAHIHYLHSDSFGNQSQPRIHGMTATRPGPYHVESSFRIHNKPMNKLWEWTNTGDSVPVTARAMLPSTSSVNIELAHGIQMITFVNTVPISENRCVNRFSLIRNFMGWDGFDDYARNQMYKILGEDKAMVERLHPEALDHEFSLAPDGPQVAFRKLRAEWAALGYVSRSGIGRAPRAAEEPRAGDM